MNENESKDELSKLLRESADKAELIIEQVENIQSWAQRTLDLSKAGQEVMKYPIPTQVNWGTVVATLRQANNQSDMVLQNMMYLSSTAPSTDSGLNFAMAEFVVSPSNLQSWPFFPEKEQAILAQENLNNIIDQSFKKEDVIVLMREFDLGNGEVGKQNAIEQFEIAWAAYERPITQSSPVITSLIPMREAVEATIYELIRRRPTQEEAKGQQNKIISIGRQLCRDGISEEAIQTWALQWGQSKLGLADRLSGSKQRKISRDDWRNLLRQATLFLQELLLGLDPSKLR